MKTQLQPAAQMSFGFGLTTFSAADIRIGETNHSITVHVGDTLMILSGAGRDLYERETIDEALSGLDSEDAIGALASMGFREVGRFH